MNVFTQLKEMQTFPKTTTKKKGQVITCRKGHVIKQLPDENLPLNQVLLSHDLQAAGVSTKLQPIFKCQAAPTEG